MTSPHIGWRQCSETSSQCHAADGWSLNFLVVFFPLRAGFFFCYPSSDWFHYETVRIVNIKSMKAGLIFRLVQILIIAYVIGYSIVWKKGYQATCEGAGDSVSKLKGVAYSNGTEPWLGPNATTSSFTIYDTYDLVPASLPMEANAIFVTTNQWVTLGQTRSRCVFYDPSNACDESHPCRKLHMTNAGRQIGPDRCLTNTTDPKQPYPTPKGSFCEIYGWCPTENELPRQMNTFRLRGVENFTVFTRIVMRYDAFDKVLDNTQEDELTPGLNKWSLGEMVQQAGFQWKDINATGAIIAMETTWSARQAPNIADSRHSQQRNRKTERMRMQRPGCSILPPLLTCLLCFAVDFFFWLSLCFLLAAAFFLLLIIASFQGL